MHDDWDDLREQYDDELEAYRATWWARLLGYAIVAIVGGATAVVISAVLAVLGVGPPGWDTFLAYWWGRLTP